jgi:hypothetical protein
MKIKENKRKNKRKNKGKNKRKNKGKDKGKNCGFLRHSCQIQESFTPKNLIFADATLNS